MRLFGFTVVSTASLDRLRKLAVEGWPLDHGAISKLADELYAAQGWTLTAQFEKRSALRDAVLVGDAAKRGQIIIDRLRSQLLKAGLTPCA